MPLDDRDRASTSRSEGDSMSIHVHILVRVADPEAELERRIAQRVSDRISQTSWLESSAELDDQVADSDAAHACAEQPEEIGDRHDAERQTLAGLEPDRCSAVGKGAREQRCCEQRDRETAADRDREERALERC